MSPSARRVRLFIGVMGSFALGAAVGTAGYLQLKSAILWPAVIALAGGALLLVRAAPAPASGSSTMAPASLRRRMSARQ